MGSRPSRASRPGPLANACRDRRVLGLAAPILLFFIHERNSPSVYKETRLSRLSLSNHGLGHIQSTRHDDGNVRISFKLHEYNESAITRFAGVPGSYKFTFVSSSNCN
mmetsp:Transcript_17539/g.40901  ORF Transcript_17539/g.40901 Transcript_17539/m.40901 type:complete len:108 (-) Transcript_17539:2559-2882(-)